MVTQIYLTISTQGYARKLENRGYTVWVNGLNQAAAL